MNKKKMTAFVACTYLILLVWLVLFKLATDASLIPHYRGINWIPFAQSVIVNGEIYIKEIIYNMLVFIPCGVYLQYLFPEKPGWKKIGSGFLLSLSLETAQLVFALGASDITDLLSNTMGVILGLGLFQLIEKKFKERSIQIVNTIGLSIEFCAIALALLLSLANR